MPADPERLEVLLPLVAPRVAHHFLDARRPLGRKRGHGAAGVVESLEARDEGHRAGAARSSRQRGRVALFDALGPELEEARPRLVGFVRVDVDGHVGVARVLHGRGGERVRAREATPARVRPMGLP